MSTAAYPHLLAPGRIGTMRLRNRIVMSPMETMYGTPEGLPSERTIAYFAERARGGVGLVTVGATGIDHRHPETPGGLQIGTDDAVAAHRDLVDAVHEHGACIQPQVVHAGPDGLGPEMFGVESIGPSVIPSYLTGRPSRPVTPEEIRGVLDQFRAAVVRIREAGYDGLELHAAHGYMFLGSFLAPQRNRRTDDYRGDSVEGRIRVLLEALQAIRGEVGPDFPITLRISGYERVAAGRPVWETAQVAPLLVEAGVDAFHVSGGVIDRLVTGMVNAADDGDALNVGAAAAVRQAVDVPVIAVGRLHDPLLAEQVLAEGRADFVAMGRPLLADAELPAKLAAGLPVRPCISCENCIDALEQRFSVDCAVNARTGRERELVAAPVASPRHVVVVGAGPAGMEAARVAAGRGHRVTLLEREAAPGGALVAASAVHEENRPLLGFLEGELARLGVDVRLGVEATPDAVRDLRPDAVVVATGGRGGARDLVLGGGLDGLRRRVVIVGGSQMAVEVAETLARRGHLVTILTEADVLAPEVGWKRRTEHMDRLDRLAITAHVRATIGDVGEGGVRFTPWRGTPRVLPADDVLVVGEVAADTTTYDALVAALPDVEVHAIGDCRAPGLIRDAIESAMRVACAL